VDANGTVVTITRRSARASDKIYLKQEMFIKEIKLHLKENKEKGNPWIYVPFSEIRGMTLRAGLTHLFGQHVSLKCDKNVAPR